MAEGTTEDLGLPSPSFTAHQLREARAQAVSLAEKNERLARALLSARQQVEELGAQLDAVTRPPVSLATVTAVPPGAQEVEVVLGGRTMRLGTHPSLDAESLAPGALAAVNDQMLVTGVLPAPDTGEAVTVDEVLAPGHAGPRVLATTGGGASRVLTLGGEVRAEALRPGDTLAADLRAGVATAVVGRTGVAQLVVTEAPDVSWEDIGGLGPQIEVIRDALELPYAHPGLYRRYGLDAPHGLLLYGPPGCGKTLIAKAVATSLARADGGTRPAAFLSVKGPELLSKFVGETERQVRAVFEQARRAAAEDRPVVIFFDEMESLFRTRGTGVSSDVETTVVPQVLAEIDGVESLRNVLVIGASNREDMIDPAVLRPGRLDVHVRVGRPTAEGALDVLARHLTADLPLDATEVAAAGGDREAAAGAMRRATVEALYARGPATAVLEATDASGATTTLHLADLVSGAMLAAVVARAKTAAVKDEIAGGPGGLSTPRLLAAVRAEALQNEEAAGATSPDGWARVTGHRGATVVSVRRLTHQEET